MSKLTSFQNVCGSELEKRLHAIGYEANRWEIINGREETYIEAEVGPLKIWIYEDGACWQGLGRDRVLEAVDFDSLDDLQKAFLEEIAAALTHRAI